MAKFTRSLARVGQAVQVQVSITKETPAAPIRTALVVEVRVAVRRAITASLAQPPRASAEEAVQVRRRRAMVHNPTLLGEHLEEQVDAATTQVMVVVAAAELATREESEAVETKELAIRDKLEQVAF